MKKAITKILSLILTISICFCCMFVSIFATTFNDINQSSIFVKQAEGNTCTLAAAVMLVRRTALASGNSSWSNITEASMKSTAWAPGLYYNFTYANIKVGHSTISSNRKNTYIALLKTYPQGVVAWNSGNGGQTHAVLLTDYDSNTDTFYCADPSNYVACGRIPLAESSIVGYGQDGKINNLDEYWYVISPSVTLTSNEPTSIIYPTSGSIYKIASGVGNKMYLDFAVSSNNVQIYENCDGHKDSAYVKSQYYKLTHVGDGWYSIVNIGNGKAVDVYDWRTASGTNIQQWDLHGGDCQLFRFYDAGDGYCYIKSKLGTYVDAEGAIAANNTNVWAYSFNGSNARKWKLEKHSHSYSSKVTTPATCTKSGVKTYTCSKCKDSYTEKISTSGNHTYGGWTVTKNASCTENGSQQRKCSKCGNVQNEKIAATGHNYQSKTIAANCKDYEKIQYTCKNCNHTYEEYTKDKFSEWSTSKPSGIDENLIERKTQYRYSDYVTKTSYETSMSGYTKISNTWENTGSGTVQYVKSWPSGFNKAHGLYSTYNKSPKSKSETATNKTVINDEQIAGYLYYHWCRGTYTSGPINRTTKDVQTGEFNAFHAFYSTTSPNGLTAASDGSYVHANGNCCKDSHWYYCIAVYKQTYTTYKNLYKYEKWTSWSDWSDKTYTSTSTRKVETRTLYRYSNNQIGNHSYENGKCIYCGSVDVGVVKMGDVDTNGKISASDARLVLRTSVGLETLTESLIVVADVNKDNKISAADARLILRASVGLEDASLWN